MKISVLYFTRSGSSEKIAEKIAALINEKAVRIDDGIDWSGDDGYKKAVKYSMENVKVSVNIADDIKNSDEFIAVTPLWCGKAAPAVNALFELIPKEKTHLVVSSIASRIQERDGYKSVTDIVSRDGDDVSNKKIEELVRSLNLN